MQSNSQQVIHLPVYTQKGLIQLAIPAYTLQLSIQQIPKIVYNLIGFSSRIYFYHYPLSCFGRMIDLEEGTFGELMTKYPNICITFANTQFQEERMLGYEGLIQLSDHKISVILQFMSQNSIFIHEQFVVPLSSPCSNLIGITGRYRKEFSLQFHELRLPLSHFIEELSIKDAIPWAQQNGYLLISEGIGQNIKKQTLCASDQNWWKIVGYGDGIGIVSKKRNWKIVSWMLKEIVSNAEAYCEKQKNFLPIQEIKQPNLSFSEKIILRSPPTNTYSLPNPMKNTIFLGLHQNYLYFITESAIVSIFASKYPFQLISTHHLLCPPTTNYDQDLSYISPPYLISYSITINFIKVKYYDLKTMNFLFLRNWQWKIDLYGQILFQVIDLFAVRHKKTYFIQVFSIQSPKDSMIIDNFIETSKFHSSRAGLNPFSDKSGIFAVHNPNLNRSRIFSLKLKVKLFEVDHMRHQIVKNIIFSQGSTEKYVTFCMQNADLVQYRFSTEKQNKNQILNHLKDCNANGNQTYIYGFDELIIIALGKNSFRIIGDKKISKMSEGTIVIEKNKAMALIKFVTNQSTIKDILFW